MKKIKIELNPNELAILMHLVSEKEKQISDLTLDAFVSLSLKDKLITNLNDEQRSETIKVQVKASISRLIGKPLSQINDKSSLTRDLHMTSPQVRSRSIPFTSIARQFKSGVTISSDECEEQDTVQDCVTLIESKI